MNDAAPNMQPCYHSLSAFQRRKVISAAEEEDEEEEVYLRSESRTILTAPGIVAGNNSQKTLKQRQLREKDANPKCTAKPQRPLHYKLYYTPLGERAGYSTATQIWEPCTHTLGVPQK